MKTKASRSPFVIPRNISIASLAVAILLLGLSLPEALKQSQINTGIKATAEREKTKQEVQTDLEVARVENERRRADAYRDNQIADYPTLTLAGYINTPDLRPDDWVNVVPPRPEKTIIYDETNVCIGVVENGVFTWVHDPGQADICNKLLNK